jgi:2-keto-4-pentenoate hydratase/2-oxohepta-3-ene-1,7-dioic acid hydratase in catechol pathway
MRIVRWSEPGSDDVRLGLWIDDMVADAGSPQELGLPPGTGAEGILAGGPQALIDFEGRAVSRTRRPRAEVRLHSPLARPSKILCLGLNYRSHAEEQDQEPPAEPRIFLKPPSAICGPEDDIVVPDFCHHVDPEVELAIVVGKRTKRVSAARARRHVAGYTILNDVSERKLQKQDVQYSRAKGIDTFCPMGPALVTKDEIAEPGDLAIRLSVDGEVRQDARTSQMERPIGEILEFISRTMTLEPGDVIATGTPAGVGVHRDPKVFLEAGQVVTCEIEGIGTLVNRVRGEDDA